MADGPQAVVLAAGRGTRMRSDVPKVLHPLAGRALILHVIDLAAAVTGRRPVVVVSPDQPEVRDLVGSVADVVEQPEPRGTGDALNRVPASRREPGEVLVLSGDVPLLRPETVSSLLEQHRVSRPACTLLTATPTDPSGLGRVVRDMRGAVAGILEERDLPVDTPAPVECNVGVYVFDSVRLWPALQRITPDNAQGEYYLTDAVALLEGPVITVPVADPDEALGINDRRQLAAAEAVLRRRSLDALMLDGVTIEDPVTTYVDAAVRIGRDSVIRPMTMLRGSTRLGERCTVGPMARLRDVVAGDGVRIGASSLEECELGDDVVIGDFDRLRPGTSLDDAVELGTHAEVKNSRIGRGTRISHFSCVLDSDVGEEVNIGAGTVTCNFDGADKHRTTIGDRVFVGSDSILVAPITIGPDAYIGAGSVITTDVPAGALAVERTDQRTLPGWAERQRRRSARLTEEASA